MKSPKEVHARLNQDLWFFAKHGPLLIKPKSVESSINPGELVPSSALVRWEPNIPQLVMQAAAEEQRKETGGWVRLVMVKGRQQGGSTWVQGRFYHKVRSVPGTEALIVAHEGRATANLFKMVENYHYNVQPLLRPKIGKQNVNLFTFPDISSGYKALTAGNDDAGRSATAQLIHGSEVAYWPNDYAMQDSLLETVALLPGTEVVLESTGNGPKGLFYDKVMLAIRRQGDYRLVFIPWYWQHEYEREPAPGFEFNAEEKEYVAIHFPKGKCFPYETEPPAPWRILRKMAWRRSKILDFSTKSGGVNLEVGLAKFQRIYPSFPQEPFQNAGLGLIRADALNAARRNYSLNDPEGALVMGVDPALDSENSDRTVLVLRRGRVVEDVIVRDRMRPMELAGMVDRIIKERDVQMTFFDNAHGTGPVDRLREMGHAQRVVGIWFNERSSFPNLYRNKRSEIIIETAKWVNEGNVRIPDDDDVIADLAAMPLDEEDSNGIHYVKSKKEIKKILGRSPDIYDALALTFAYPVRRPSVVNINSDLTYKRGGNVSAARGGGPLKSMSRFRTGKRR